MAWLDFKTFRGGLYSNVSPTEIPDNAAQVLTNLLVDEDRLRLRKGRTRERTSGGSNPIVGMGIGYIKDVRQVLILEDTGPNRTLLKLNTNGTTTSLDTGLAGTTLSTCMLDGMMFVTTGAANEQFRYDGTTLHKWGISEPVATPGTPSDKGAGNLTGTYEYYVTFVAADGTESNPSLASAAITVASREVTVEGVDTATDAQVVGRNIYRSGGTLTGIRRLGTGTYTVTGDVATDYDDNEADVTIAANDEMPARHDGAPQLQWIVTHNQRIWGVDATNKDIIRVSNSDDPPGRYFPALQVDDFDGGTIQSQNASFGQIQSLASYGSFLAVLRRGGVELWAGSDWGGDFIHQHAASAAEGGSASPHSMAVVTRPTEAGDVTEVWFNDTDGVKALGPTGVVTRVGFQVEDIVRGDSLLMPPIEIAAGSGTPTDRREATVGVFDGRFYYLFYTRDGQTSNNDALVYDTTFNYWTHFDSVPCSAAVVLAGDSGEQHDILMGQPVTTGDVWRNDGTDDIGTKIGYAWRGKAVRAEGEHRVRLKRRRYTARWNHLVSFDCHFGEVVNGGGAVTISTIQATTSHTTGVPEEVRGSLGPNARGREFSIAIRGAADTGHDSQTDRIEAIGVEAVQIGRPR